MKIERANNIENLDAFRGILSLSVVIWHSMSLSKLPIFNAFKNNLNFEFMFRVGTSAVDGFFSLSGFILAHVYQEKFSKAFKSSIKVFFWTYFKFIFYRIARIWPMHFFCSSIVFFYFREWKLKNYFLEILFASTIRQTYINIPSWSLSIEFICYLCFPVYIYLLEKISNQKYSLLCLLITYSILTLVNIYTAIYAALLIKDFFWLNVRGSLGFVSGIILYKVFQIFPEKKFYWDFIFLINFIASLVVMYYTRLSFYYFHVFFVINNSFFLAKANFFIKKLFETRFFNFLGDISYSLYVVHFFFFKFCYFVEISKNETYFGTCVFFVIFFTSKQTFIYVECFWRKKFRNFWMIYLERFIVKHQESYSLKENDESMSKTEIQVKDQEIYLEKNERLTEFELYKN